MLRRVQVRHRAPEPRPLLVALVSAVLVWPPRSGWPSPRGSPDEASPGRAAQAARQDTGPPPGPAGDPGRRVGRLGDLASGHSGGVSSTFIDQGGLSDVEVAFVSLAAHGEPACSP